MYINYLTIKEALKGLEKKTFSSVELVKTCLGQIRKYEGKINAFITVREKESLDEAKRADAQRISQSKKDKPLLGIPIALKDMYLTQNIGTTAGSNILKNYENPQYDATAVQRLKEAGAIIIGKTNQDAWAHGASGENSDFGPTKNPWDLKRVPGGSSSGSGAAVAAGMCFAAGGTDTGGSLRNPASFCNLTALKPTYGLVSRYGVVAMASSLDCMGNITRSVSDSAEILKVTAGKDKMDATTSDINHKDYTEEIQNLRVGIPEEYFTDGVNSEVQAAVLKAIGVFEENGAEVEKISLPHTEYGIAVYYIIMSSETSSNLARYDGIRYGEIRRLFGAEAKRRIMLGTYALSAGYYEAYYKKAMQVRTLIKRDFERAFDKVNVLIAPATPTPPFILGEKQSPLEMYLSDVLTIPSSLAGIPALALPCGFSKNRLPIGMQIIGPQFSEGLLFKLGEFYQQLTNWHKRIPKFPG